MSTFRVRYFDNLQIKEIFVTARSRYEARKIFRSIYGNVVIVQINAE